MTEFPPSDYLSHMICSKSAVKDTLPLDTIYQINHSRDICAQPEIKPATLGLFYQRSKPLFKDQMESLMLKLPNTNLSPDKNAP